jgi:hypothetical protein
VVGLNDHVEQQPLIALRVHLDVMGPGDQIQMLEVPVELIDEARVLAVHEHLRILGFDPQS